MQAVAAANLRSHPKIGTISGYDPNKQAVKVLLQPEGNETGWIPLGSLWVGPGWGLVCAPNLGSQVEVTFVDGNDESGSANLRFFSNVEQGPAAPGGELWVVHAKGGSFKLTNDGKVSFNDGHGASIILDGDGTITSAASKWTHTGEMDITGTVNISGNTNVTGTIDATGDIIASGTVTGSTDVVGHLTSVRSHEHSGVQSGTSNTGVPV